MIAFAFVICGLLAWYQIKASREARRNNLKRIQDEIKRLEAAKEKENTDV